MSATVIAIDGPAAAGKGTLARRLAEHFGFAHLDSGSLYRAVALKVLRAGGDPADAEAAAAAARGLTADDLDDPGLRGEAAAQGASEAAAIPAVRAALVEYQRRFAAQPPGDAKGAVIDGRDIGTVICPDAPLKLFVTASLKARVERRLKELREKGIEASAEEVERDMRARDARDSERDISPLAPAPDAYLLDTTNLDIDSAFAAAKAYIGARMS